MISGLVISFVPDSHACECAVAQLLQTGVFDLGQPQGHRLPVVLEAADASESESWYQWLTTLPGVIKVDVALVADEAALPPTPSLLPILPSNGH